MAASTTSPAVEDRPLSDWLNAATNPDRRGIDQEALSAIVSILFDVPQRCVRLGVGDGWRGEEAVGRCVGKSRKGGARRRADELMVLLEVKLQDSSPSRVLKAVGVRDRHVGFRSGAAPT